MARYRRWTPVEEAILRIHFDTTPYPEIARALGRTTEQVETKVHRLGLRRRGTHSTVRKKKELKKQHSEELLMESPEALKEYL